MQTYLLDHLWMQKQNLHLPPKFTHEDTHHVNLREHAQIFLGAEFAPTFLHLKEEGNAGADGLSQLPMVDKTPLKIANSIFAISSLDRETKYNFPLDMR
jgi:hypothetical protein